MKSAATILASIYGKSDRRLKTDIEDGSRDVSEMLDALRPYAYRYIAPEKHEEGRQIGVMAQDLARSATGRSAVAEMPYGLGVDMWKAVSALLASVAYLNDELKRTKSELQELKAEVE